MIKLSPEQVAIKAHLRTTTSSLTIVALAGTGKTSTLIECLPEITATGDALLLAFNKKIAQELDERVQRLPLEVRFKTKVGTVHATALAAWKAGGKKSRVQGGKVRFMLQDMLDKRRLSDNNHPLVKGRSLICRLVSFAKSAGFGLSSKHEHFPSISDLDAWAQLIDHFNMEMDLDAVGLDTATAIKTAMELLQASNANHAMIDFDDMIYLPLLNGMKLKQYSNVMIDEAQDTNITRREFAFRSCKDGGRIIAVGDPHQAIYGFTGADAKALRNITTRAHAQELPLSTCWRCDQRIIEHAQQIVPAIKSHDVHGNGEVRYTEFDHAFIDSLVEGDAVLCRLNKPNVSLAIALLRRGKSARIEGRDLGEKLLSHARKAAPDKPPLAELQLALEPYLMHNQQLLLNREKEAEAQLLEDEIDALHILIERCLELGKGQYANLENLCAELFVDEGHKQRCILLCSVHKSKGLEWPRVYLLGRSDYMPFWKATMEWESEQEQNLIYVAVTRAQHELIEVTGVKAALDAGVHRQMPTERPKLAIGDATPRSDQTAPRLEVPNYHQQAKAAAQHHAKQMASPALTKQDIAATLLSGLTFD